MNREPGSPDPGAPDLDVPAGLQKIVRADLVGTAVFTVAAIGAAAWPDGLRLPYAGLSLVLFAVGFVAFVWAFLVAVGRSRHEYISTASIWFLTGGTVPGPVRARLMGALAAQVVVSIAAASVRPFTAVAFGILAPMFGLGLAGLAGARFGTFEARPGEGQARPREGTGPPG